MPAVAILLAFLAIFLGALAVLRGEGLIYAGVAAILGIGAIGFQLTIFYAFAVSVILIMYAAMERPAGAFVLAFIAVCAMLVLSILAIIGMGLVSALLWAAAP